MLEVLVSFGVVTVVSTWGMSLNTLIVYFLYLLIQFYDCSLTIKWIFIMLSIWITLMMLMSVEVKFYSPNLLTLFMITLFCLILLFYADTLIWFYLGFEMSVIPIFLIIFGWGYQPERLEAGFYMLCYTVGFSLPLLLQVMYIDYLNDSCSFLSFIMLMAAFLVKIPMVGLHFWLPRAHVEAPVFGSMILAGVMLKLGGYGVYKISLVMGDSLVVYTEVLILVSMIGGTLLSLVCFVQSDMKLLVAYSSIVHMSIVLSGLLTFHEFSLVGGVYLMLGHGFCSSGLFCVLGLTYNRSLTRSIMVNKGLITVIPICSLWWFLFCSSNLSFPPCLNLPGELLLVLSLLNFNFSFTFLLFFYGILSALYSIYLYSVSQQSFIFNFFCFKSFSVQESLMLFLHWVPLNLLILDLSLLTY